MSLNRRNLLGAVAASVSVNAEDCVYTLVPDAAGKTLKAPDGRVVFYLSRAA